MYFLVERRGGYRKIYNLSYSCHVVAEKGVYGSEFLFQKR